MSTQSNIVKFSTNWNKKLDTNYFTTLRFSNRIRDHKTVLIEFKGQYRVAKVVDHRKLMLKDLNDWICFLDSGYNSLETLSILKKMYPNVTLEPTHQINWFLLNAISPWITIEETKDFF